MINYGEFWVILDIKEGFIIYGDWASFVQKGLKMADKPRLQSKRTPSDTEWLDIEHLNKIAFLI